jgi:hypothetical protein
MGPDVRARLADEIDAALQHWTGLPFVWGESDCALAIADIYRIALGVDPAAAWRGRYDCETGAKIVLGRRGLRAALSGAARTLGWKRIAAENARPGDLGMVRTTLGPACAIRHRDLWAARGDRGFSLVSDAKVLLAWSIGA